MKSLTDDEGYSEIHIRQEKFQLRDRDESDFENISDTDGQIVLEVECDVTNFSRDNTQNTVIKRLLKDIIQNENFKIKIHCVRIPYQVPDNQIIQELKNLEE